jgi:PAS domain S-box-containing protein
MPTLVLVDLLPERRRVLLSERPPYDVREVTSEDLDDVLDEDVAAVVVGSACPEPVRTVQAVHAVAPLAGVAVLTDAETETERRRALSYAPRVPASLEILDEQDPRLSGLAEKLVEDASRRRRHRLLLGAVTNRPAMDQQLVAPASLGALLDHAPFGVLVAGVDGRLVAWNRTAAALLDLPDDAAGDQVPGMFSDPVPFEEVFGRARAGRLTGAVEPQTVEDDNGQALEVTAVPSRLEDGRDAVLVLVQDVTGRREAERSRDRLAAQVGLFARISEAMAGALDPDATLRRLAASVVPTLGDWVSLVLFDSRGHPLQGVIHHRDAHLEPLAESASALLPEALTVDSPGRRIAAGEPYFRISDVSEEQLAGIVTDPEVRRLLRRFGLRHLLAVPLPGREGPLGAMVLVNAPRSPRFNDQDLAVALEVGRRAGVALRTADLFVQQRDLAAELQRSMLTDPPEPDHMQIAVRYVAAAQEAQVGGDWYDAFMQADGATVVVIGDVIGHDTRAAAAMGQVRGLLRGIGFTTGSGPAEILRRLDAAIEGLVVNTTATAFVARIERPGGSLDAPAVLRWSNAGHPPPMLIPYGGVPQAVVAERTDLLLGVLTDTERREHTAPLGPGCTLLLYTDGLVERRGQSIDAGIELLLSALERLGHLPLENLCDRLLAELLPVDAEDDAALLAVRLHPQDRPRPPEAGPRRTPPEVPAPSA